MTKSGGNPFARKNADVLGTTAVGAVARTLQEMGVGVRGVRTIPLDQIQVNPDQPRRYFNSESLEELAQSIRSLGVQQPILLRPVADRKYQIVFGERRYRAARKAGLSEIPAMVREMDSAEAMSLAAMENLQREDLNPFEEASYKLTLIAQTLGIPQSELPPYLRLLHRHLGEGRVIEHPEHVTSLEQLFAQFGGSWRTFAVHGLRVLSLPENLKAALQTGQLEYSKAVAINAAGTQHHDALLKLALEDGLTLTELQAEIASLAGKPEQNPTMARLKSRLTTRKWAALSKAKQKEAQRLMEQLTVLLDS